MKYLKTVIFKIHNLAKGLFFGLMVTTMWMAYRVIEPAIGGGLPHPWDAVLVVLASLVVTYLIDNDLHSHAVAAFAAAVEVGSVRALLRGSGFATLIFFILMGARFFFSGGATYFSGESTVAARVATSDTGTDKALLSLQSDKRSAIASVRTARDKEAQQVLENAEGLAAAKVRTAIKQGSPREQQDYHAGKWVRPAYSIAIKKAEREAYRIQEEAQRKYDRIQEAKRSEIAAIEKDPSWGQVTAAIQQKQRAHDVLASAEQWTYYLLDFILVFGGLGCAFLQGWYLVHSKQEITIFFSDKPGLLDVVMDALGGLYALGVAETSRVAAWIKSGTASEMNKAAKRASGAATTYQYALAQYLVATHTSTAAETAQQAQQVAQQVAKQQGKQAAAKAMRDVMKEEGKTQAEEGKVMEERTKQHNTRRLGDAIHANYMPPTPTALGSHDTETIPKHTETEPKQNRNSAPETVSASGDAFRSYLARARAALRVGDAAKAKRHLASAVAALPDDHNRADRMAKIEAVRDALNNNQ